MVIKSQDQFISQYEMHDTADEYVRALIYDTFEISDVIIEQWGIDNRHDGVQYDDKMDLRVWQVPSNHTKSLLLEREDVDYRRHCKLVAQLDVKSKSQKEWMRTLNQRHLDDYTRHAERTDDSVQTLVVSCRVSHSHVMDTEMIDVEDAETHNRREAWDGNIVVDLSGGDATLEGAEVLCACNADHISSHCVDAVVSPS